MYAVYDIDFVGGGYRVYDSYGVLWNSHSIWCPVFALEVVGDGDWVLSEHLRPDLARPGAFKVAVPAQVSARFQGNHTSAEGRAQGWC